MIKISPLLQLKKWMLTRILIIQVHLLKEGILYLNHRYWNKKMAMMMNILNLITNQMMKIINHQIRSNKALIIMKAKTKILNMIYAKTIAYHLK